MGVVLHSSVNGLRTAVPERARPRVRALVLLFPTAVSIEGALLNQFSILGFLLTPCPTLRETEALGTRRVRAGALRPQPPGPEPAPDTATVLLSSLSRWLARLTGPLKME